MGQKKSPASSRGKLNTVARWDEPQVAKADSNEGVFSCSWVVSGAMAI
jgi:hypothetical protein